MPQGTHEGENLYKKQFKSNSLLRSRAPLNRAISSTWEYTYASGPVEEAKVFSRKYFRVIRNSRKASEFPLGMNVVCWFE